MDFKELAKELMRGMRKVSKPKHKFFSDGMGGESFALHFIEQRGEVLPKDISDAMGVSTARVAAALNDLEDKGLITREIDKEDRRRIIVRVTDKGRQLSAELMGEFLLKMETILKCLGEDDAKEFVRIMGRIGRILNKETENA